MTKVGIAADAGTDMDGQNGKPFFGGNIDLHCPLSWRWHFSNLLMALDLARGVSPAPSQEWALRLRINWHCRAESLTISTWWIIWTVFPSFGQAGFAPVKSKLAPSKITPAAHCNGVHCRLPHLTGA